MGELVEQLRGLLDVARLPAVRGGLRGVLDAWEVNRASRHIATQSTVSAQESLIGLHTLTQRIPTLDVSAAIASDVDAALSALATIPSASTAADLLSISRHANAHAQEAFYAPEMLSLLYFPDDQKYAIYVPYIVPACVALFGGLYRSCRGRGHYAVQATTQGS
jgi:phosphatidylinositol glycan class S